MDAFHNLASFYGEQKPYRFEADIFDCEVKGEIPQGLAGTLYRAGPDTQYPTREGDAITNGDGMVSMFRFENGHVDFRCRYVKTKRLLAERRARRRLYGSYRNPFTDHPAAPAEDRDNTGNTFAFFHGGRLFALREDSRPHELDPDTLETLPTFDFDGELESLALCAHPKIDPQTGEWWSFGLFAKRKFTGDMALIVADRDGKLVREEHFQAPYAGISHDFAVTRDHVVFGIMPLTVDLERMREGGDFYAYDKTLPAKWGVMPRKGTVEDIRWFDVPNACTGHVMNAYSDGQKVYLDATVAPGNSFPFFKTTEGELCPFLVSSIARITFHLDSNDNKADYTIFPDATGEMPKVDDRFQMSRYRYGYMKTRDGIARLDWDTRERLLHSIPQSPGGAQEPIFVPRSPDAPEGEGWLLCLVNHNAENRADLYILDAMNIAGPPVAIVKLPFNQPMAFHGCFVPEQDLEAARRAKPRAQEPVTTC